MIDWLLLHTWIVVPGLALAWWLWYSRRHHVHWSERPRWARKR